MENIRQRLVEKSFEETLNGAPRLRSPPEELLDGEQESRIIALRLGPPPKGYANWSLRLLSRKVADLGITASISHETVRRTLKKWDDQS
ncbi:MAG: helix-turn-helix domain-containing protein [Tildeniella nuda ZEHNDER 1965/U140]|nr:helix-turn-helix domain-containing protein [Tildeniella nuda ZEHNDER 1965/U140]